MYWLALRITPAPILALTGALLAGCGNKGELFLEKAPGDADIGSVETLLDDIKGRRVKPAQGASAVDSPNGSDHE